MTTRYRPGVLSRVLGWADRLPGHGWWIYPLLYVLLIAWSHAVVWATGHVHRCVAMGRVLTRRTAHNQRSTRVSSDTDSFHRHPWRSAYGPQSAYASASSLFVSLSIREPSAAIAKSRCEPLVLTVARIHLPSGDQAGP
jgi:hypothetical protein